MQRFAEKESEYAAAHSRYDYNLTVRVQELDADDDVIGSFEQKGRVEFNSRGQRVLTLFSNPQSDLTRLGIQGVSLDDLVRVPLFILRPEEIEKYDITYLTSEKVDEVNTHLFRLRPKGVPRLPDIYFQGIVWVDARHFDVVRAQGRLVPAYTSGVFGRRFQTIEIFRQPVDDYLFTTYVRSDEVLLVRNGEEIRAQLVVRFDGHELRGSKPDEDENEGEEAGTDPPGEEESEEPEPEPEEEEPPIT